MTVTGDGVGGMCARPYNLQHNQIDYAGALRRLQLAGKVSIRYANGSSPEKVTLAFMDTGKFDEDETLARRLLKCPKAKGTSKS